MDIEGFVPFCNTLDKKIAYTAQGPSSVEIPFVSDPFDADAVSRPVTAASHFLPLIYQQQYITPLMNNLQTIVAGLQQGGLAEDKAATFLEPLTGVVYDRAISDVRPAAQRFQAVISDLYQSFLDKAKRAKLNLPLIEQLPPLATFAFDAKQGPFTIPADDIVREFGAKIGVVSLPASYREHPVIWAALNHECGGHDVAHADPSLLDELRRGVIAAVSVGNQPKDREIGQLWAYWMDEAVADVYGLLNGGPAFAFNLAAFFTTLLKQITEGNTAIPKLDNKSFIDGNGQLDPHPTDLLRLHLAIGVTESLHGLAVTTRGSYVDALLQLAAICTPDGATTVDFVKNAEVVETFSLETMQSAARAAGAFISTVKLNALTDHSIQDIETWDDADEEITQAIASAYLAGTPVAGLGDDAQLLSGATLALLNNSEAYDQVTSLLNLGLDLSYARDPIFGSMHPRPIHFRTIQTPLSLREIAVSQPNF